MSVTNSGFAAASSLPNRQPVKTPDWLRPYVSPVGNIVDHNQQLEASKTAAAKTSRQQGFGDRNVIVKKKKKTTTKRKRPLKKKPRKKPSRPAKKRNSLRKVCKNFAKPPVL